MKRDHDERPFLLLWRLSVISVVVLVAFLLGHACGESQPAGASQPGSAATKGW